jgi:hypothetical protein
MSLVSISTKGSLLMLGILFFVASTNSGIFRSRARSVCSDGWLFSVSLVSGGCCSLLVGLKGSYDLKSDMFIKWFD